MVTTFTSPTLSATEHNQLSTTRTIVEPMGMYNSDKSSDTSNNPFQLFLRKILQDEYSLRKILDGQHGNRFCVLFAHMLMQVTNILRHKQSSHGSVWLKEGLANLEKLLYEALHSANENFQLWYDIAYNAEIYGIIVLLPENETSAFYEAMVNASKRHSKVQHGTMLSSYGYIMCIIHKRVLEAYDQFMKARGILVPLGDSRNLAQLYLRIGQISFIKGTYKEAERYV